eukprot:scaffold8161_cov111-Cylindrotheca_fusiformis.AAC.9
MVDRHHHLHQEGNNNNNNTSSSTDTEVEVLRALIASQREQLRQRDEELLHLRRHAMYPALSASVNHASNPYQETTSDDSCDGGPYNLLMIHSTMTWLCEIVLSKMRRIRHLSNNNGRRMTSSSLSSASLHRQTRFIRSLNVFIICILVVHFWQFRIMREFVLNKPPIRMDSGNLMMSPVAPVERNTVQEFQWNIVKPWTSRPPTPIRLLMDTNGDPKILKRHQCIAAVRTRQEAFFQEFFVDNSGPSPQEVLLVDPAYHSNVGDVMLTIGELQLVQGTMKQRPPKQCHYVQAKNFYPPCDSTASVLGGSNQQQQQQQPQQRLALWHAGGNWGDLWRSAQDVRIPSFRTLLQNNFQIVSMPQSLYYEDPALKEKDIQWMKEMIATGLGLESAAVLDTQEGQQISQSQVILTWRERESWQEAKELYPFVRNVLIPDIAFQIGPYSPILPSTQEEQVDLLLLLRDDKESKVTKERDASPTQFVQYSRLSLYRQFHPTVIIGQGCYLRSVSGKISKTFSAAFDETDGCLDGTKANWAKASNLKEAVQKATDIAERLKGTSRGFRSFLSP